MLKNTIILVDEWEVVAFLMSLDVLQLCWLIAAFIGTALLAPFLSGAKGRIPPPFWAIVPGFGFLYFFINSSSIWKGEV